MKLSGKKRDGEEDQEDREGQLIDSHFSINFLIQIILIHLMIFKKYNHFDSNNLPFIGINFVAFSINEFAVSSCTP